MRLLYLSADPGVPVLGHKGASVHLREMVAALAARVSVVLASPRVDPEGDVLEAPVELCRLPGVLPREHPTAASLRRAMAAQAESAVRIAREQRVDAVYERYSLFSYAGVEIARELAVPHVLEVNAPLREEARTFRSLPHPDVAEEIEARVYGATDRVFAVSAVLAELLAAAGFDAGRIEVVPNAVAADKFGRRRRAGGFTVGFAGSLKPWHGVDVLVAALRSARAECPGLRLEVVGTGPLAERLVEAEPLTRHGALPHRATLALMAGWDVGLAPFLAMPRFYFSPLKVVEYMAAGACPVASDVGEIPRLLGGGTRGVLVPPGDADALAAALVSAARDPARTAELGRRARAYARGRTWNHNAARALAALSPAGVA